MSTRPTRAALTVLLAAVAVSCSGTGTAAPMSPVAGDVITPATSPTSTGAVTVVHIGTEEHDDGPAAQMLRLFVDEVADLSDGHVVVEPSFSVVGALGGGVAWDQHAIQLAADGAFDGVVARAGAWHTSGVTSLDVLELPGLVESDEQADRLAADATAVERVLAGLPAAGFTGLAFYPEAPRYLMLLDGTTDFSPGALEARTVRAPLSETVFALLARLGMVPVDLTAGDFTVQVPEGTVTATEGHLARVAVTTTADGTSDAAVAVNVPLYTKFLVLALRDGAVSPEVEAVLRDAARTTLGRYLADRAQETDSLAEACAAGGVMVTVPDAERAAIVVAMEQVVDEFAVSPDGGLLDVVRTAAGAAPEKDLRCPS